MKKTENFTPQQETKCAPACAPERALSALEIKELKRTLAALIVGG